MAGIGLGLGLGIGAGGSGSGGVSLTASTSSFLSNVTPGTVIATLNDPYGGGSAFSVVGSPPGQLALAGGNITAGAAAPAASQDYTITIRAAKAGRAIEEPLTFSCVAPPVVPGTLGQMDFSTPANSGLLALILEDF